MGSTVVPFPLPLTLGYADGLVPIPQSAFGSNALPANSDVLLSRLRANANWNGTCIEAFYAIVASGQQVSPPVSACTGYQYQPFECFVFGSWCNSLQANGSQGASGYLNIQALHIDSSFNVTSDEWYYVPGGQQTLTNDGVLIIWIIGVRGWGQTNLIAPPTFTDLSDTFFAQDQPMEETTWQELNNNCCQPRREFFLNNCVPIVRISRGNNLVTAITKTPHGLSVGNQFDVFNVNDPTFDSTTATLLPGNQHFVVVSVPSSTQLTWYQQNGANSNSFSGRLQIYGYSNGQTVPTPTSPVDGYQYVRSECTMVPLLKYTGNPSGSGPSGGGVLTRLGPFSINSSTGVLSSTITYSVGGATNDGLFDVACFAQRGSNAGFTGSPPMSAKHVKYNGTDEAYYLMGQLLTDEICISLNQDAKESLARPEFFAFSGTNGIQIGPQTSPLDDSVYSLAQQLYLWTLKDTGSIGGNITSYGIQVTQVDLYWAPGVEYAAGTQVIDYNGNYELCVTGGVSGETPPQWPLQRFNSTAYSLGQIIVDANFNQQICTTAGTTGSTPPGTWGTTSGATTHDGTVIWTFYVTGDDTDDNTVVWQWQGVATFTAGTIAAIVNGSPGPTVQGVVVGYRS